MRDAEFDRPHLGARFHSQHLLTLLATESAGAQGKGDEEPYHVLGCHIPREYSFEELRVLLMLWPDQDQVDVFGKLRPGIDDIIKPSLNFFSN